MNANPKCPPRRRVIPIALTAVLVILALIAFDSRLLVRRYTVDAQEIGSAVRIALVTDLHSCYYGEGQSALIGALDSEKPDLVLLGGDIFDDVIAVERIVLGSVTSVASEVIEYVFVFFLLLIGQSIIGSLRSFALRIGILSPLLDLDRFDQLGAFRDRISSLFGFRFRSFF